MSQTPEVMRSRWKDKFESRRVRIYSAFSTEPLGLAIHLVFQGTLVPVRRYLSHCQGQHSQLPVIPRAAITEYPNLRNVEQQKRILKDLFFIFIYVCMSV